MLEYLQNYSVDFTGCPRVSEDTSRLQLSVKEVYREFRGFKGVQ